MPKRPARPLRPRLLSLVALTLVALAGGASALVGGASATGDRAGDRTVSTGPAGPRPAPVIYRPAGLSSTGRVPLLIALHGGHSNPTAFAAGTRLNQVADANGFVVAYLGTPVPEWVRPSDITYIGSMIDGLVRSENIDPRRVYVVGFSIGGYAAFRAGCDLSGKVAGVAIVSSAMAPLWKKPCTLSRPVSELEVAGTNDAFPVHPSPSSPISADATAAIWRSLNGCTGVSRNAQTGPTSQLLWTTCNDGARVAEYIVNGGGHAWPGAPGNTGADAAYDVSPAVWAFLSHQVASSPTAPGARIVSLKVSKAVRPVLRGALQLTEAGVQVRVTVRLGGRIAAQRLFKLGAQGASSISLALPKSAAGTKAVVQVKLTDGYGRAATVTRTVRG